jgi:hypothetical protein
VCISYQCIISYFSCKKIATLQLFTKKRDRKNTCWKTIESGCDQPHIFTSTIIIYKYQVFTKTCIFSSYKIDKYFAIENIPLVCYFLYFFCYGKQNESKFSRFYESSKLNLSTNNLLPLYLNICVCMIWLSMSEAKQGLISRFSIYCILVRNIYSCIMLYKLASIKCSLFLCPFSIARIYILGPQINEERMKKIL